MAVDAVVEPVDPERDDGVVDDLGCSPVCVEALLRRIRRPRLGKRDTNGC